MKVNLRKFFSRSAVDTKIVGDIKEPAVLKFSGFSPDNPVSNPIEDKFNRYPFASRIARVISERADPSSLVIGIYGPWGDGKTSVLNFIKRELANDPKIVVVSFNPWRFGDESVLLKSFFATLASALQQSLTTRAENLGKLLNEYGGAASLVSSPLSTFLSHGALKVDAGSGLQQVGKMLSDVSLDDLKNV
jgi:hypothetical protein